MREMARNNFRLSFFVRVTYNLLKFSSFIRSYEQKAQNVNGKNSDLDLPQVGSELDRVRVRVQKNTEPQLPTVESRRRLF